MLFTSYFFLFFFLPIVLAIYHVLPENKIGSKNILLFGASLWFYAWGEPLYVLLLLFSILINYCGGIVLKHFQTNHKP